jgi:hypothetical protein
MNMDLPIFPSIPAWMGVIVFGGGCWLLWLCSKFFLSKTDSCSDLRVSIEGNPVEKEKQFNAISALAQSHRLQIVHISESAIEIRQITQAFIEDIGKLPICPDKVKIQIDLIQDKR